MPKTASAVGVIISTILEAISETEPVDEPNVFKDPAVIFPDIMASEMASLVIENQRLRSLVNNPKIIKFTQ